MTFSAAMLSGCLRALSWLLWGVAGLVVVFLGAKGIRREAVDATELFAVAGVAAALALICGRLAAWTRDRLS